MCEQLPFREFCADPYLMGKMANMFHCGAQVRTCKEGGREGRRDYAGREAPHAVL